MRKDDNVAAGTQSGGAEAILILRSADVRRYLPMADCIAAMETVFRALHEGRADQPVRQVIRSEGGNGALYVMPASVADDAAGGMAVKLVSLFPDNASLGLESHQGVIVVFDSSNGSVRALVEAGSVTAIRTAAVSALATRLLALPHAADLAILGAGVQARSHLSAMLEVRPVRRARVWSRNPDRARSFAAEASEAHGIEVTAAESPQEALLDAAIICTVSGATRPITDRSWIAPGAHINAVGASTARTREIDGATVAAARIVVDSKAAAAAEAGDLLIPLEEGLIAGEREWTELSELVAGEPSPRRSETDITLFESLGLAVEDVAAARAVCDRARAAGCDTLRLD